MPWITVADSDIGAREEQQDRYLVVCNDDKTNQLLVVADGAGGHTKGALAAQTAITHIRENLTDLWTSEDPQEFLRKLIIQCNQAVLSLGDDDLACTTLVMVFMRSDELFWGHVGDSRLYLIRGGQVVAKTCDHSIGELRKRNDHQLGHQVIGTAENELYMCLGALANISPELDSSAAREGDSVLLCSDGLWGQVDMAKTISELSDTDLSHGSLLKTVQQSISAARTSMPEKSDNITLVVSTYLKAPNIFKRFISAIFK